MKTRMALLCAALLYTGSAFAQLGANCGEHPGVLRKQSGIVWFTPKQLEQMAIKRVEPVMPPAPVGFRYDGYVTFRILVNREGKIDCIWDGAGNSIFLPTVNEALQQWNFRPMLVNGKPVEFVGVMKFRVYAK